jgi:hypothetical protein
LTSIWSQNIHDQYIPLNPKQLLAILVGLFIVDAMGIIDVPYIDGAGAMSGIGTGDAGDISFQTDVPVPESLQKNAVPVNVKIYCYEGFDVDTPGLAGSASDQVVRVYNAAGQLLEQATTSSGTVTLTRQYLSGSTLWLQARQADVSSADPYVSPCVERQIFHSDSLEATDTVSVDPVYVRDVSATAPTLKVWDTGGAAISDNSANYFNTTDVTFTIQASAIDDDTWYGPEDFTDWKTGYVYDGGVFFVWKGTVSQPFDNYIYTWSDPTNVYYVFAMSDYLKDDTSVSNDDIVSVMLSTDGSSLVADATVVLDIVDLIQLRSAGMSSSDLIDGGGITPTAITTKVA